MALGINIVSQFDSKGIDRAIKDFKKLDNATDKAAYTLKTMDKAAIGVAKSLGRFAVIGGAVAGVVGKQLVDAASSLEESQSKVNVVFGKSSATITAFASQAAKSMGISKQAALEAAGTYGNLLQAFGLTQDAAAQMSTSLVQLAGDLASFNNVAVEDALLALRSGLSGETEPLKRFGVAINDVRLKQVAMNKGWYDGKGQLDITAKSLAAYELIMKDTALAQGDYVRTADGVANRSRTIKATFEDVKAELGTALIPTYKALLSTIQDGILPVFSNFSQIVGQQGLGAGLQYLGGAMVNAVANMGLLGKAVALVTAGFVALRVASITFTAVQTTMTLATKVTTGALNAQLVALNATKIAMMAAGGVTALLAVAASVYAVYAGRKATAVQATRDFVSALKLEGDAQTDALQALYNSNEEFRRNADTIKSLGLTFDDVTSFVQTGEGAITKYAAAWKEADGSAKGIYPKLDALAKILGISTAEGYDQVAAVRNMVQFYGVMRQETINNANAQIGLALAMGNVTGALAIQHSVFKNGHPSRQRVVQDNKETEQSLEDLLKELGKVPSGMGGAGKATQTAAEKLQGFIDKLRGYTSAQQSARDATRAYKKAQEEVTAATQKTANAQAYFNQIVAGYGKDSRKGILSDRSRTKAQRDLERAGYAVENAVFAVSQAEADLAEIRLDPESTPETIRQAEIRLAEAKIAVQEATLAEVEATEALSEANREYDETVNGAKQGTDAYREALEQLQEAQRAEEEAIYSRTQAYERERDAIYELKKAKEEYDEVLRKDPNLAGKASEATGIDLPAGTTAGTSGAGYNSFMAAVRAMHPNSAALRSPTPVKDAKAQFPKLYQTYKEAGLALAKGGIVTSPTTALIGEAGPEAVIPLDQMGSGMVINITINAGMGTDPGKLGDEIVNVLQRYNRRNGALPLRVTQ